MYSFFLIYVGMLPRVASFFPSLLHLDLSQNRFSGRYISRCNTVFLVWFYVYLYLFYVYFMFILWFYTNILCLHYVETIPSEIGDLTGLLHLDLSGNQLSGRCILYIVYIVCIVSPQCHLSIVYISLRCMLYVHYMYTELYFVIM